MLFYTVNIEGGTIFTSWDEVSAFAVSFCCVTTRNVLQICIFFWSNYLFIAVTINSTIIIKSLTTQFIFARSFNVIFFVKQGLKFCMDKLEHCLAPHVANRESQVIWRYYPSITLHNIFLEQIHFSVISPNKAVEWASLLPLTWKVPVYTLCPQMGCPHWNVFVFFLSPETVGQIRRWKHSFQLIVH